MSFQPNTTVYLCAGTGIDTSNSIWWHRFAYPSSSVPNDNSWWNTCFQWFKAHSIAEGHWYCTYLDPSRGYFQIGRLPLNDRSIPMGEDGLGSSEQQYLIDSEDIPFAECLRGVDYICFVNDGEVDGVADVQYAFVTNIVSVNYNTARVFFTIDAIMTYQKYFFLGKCMVERDMQFAERVTELGIPNPQQLNLKPEPIEPEDTQYVFQRYANTFGAVQDLNLGQYNRLFVTSDVDLSDPNMIQPNAYYGGLPAFKPAPSTLIGEIGSGSNTQLGLGLYYIGNRVNPVFEKLGSFNAMEHILFSYAVPQELAPNIPTSDIVFINNTNAVYNPKYAEGAPAIELPIPSKINDDVEIVGSSGFQPINLKTLHAPYCYVSIADKQGGSVEIVPQLLGVNSNIDESFVYKLLLNLRASVAPNTASILYIDDYKGRLGRRDFPLYTAWQIPSYTMTPNNSGWRLTQISAGSYGTIGLTQVAIGGAAVAAIALGVTIATGGIGGGVLATLGNIATAAVPSAGGVSAAALMTHVASGIAGAGGGSIGNAIATKKAANIQRTYGLPKASGGLSDGYTYDTIQSAKYVPYYVHLRTDILKEIDTMFSVYGYTQNAFRFPHINIRKRWCYVQVESANILGLGANNYTKGGVPFEMRQQIQERLQSGVTFWNVRHAIMGDGDTGASDVTDYTDGRIQSCIHQQFVRNYGATADSEIMKENASWLGSYASDYSDDVNEADIV